MGGLVDKQVRYNVSSGSLHLADSTQALIAAAQGTSEEDRMIMESCIGLLLFGVPNRGLNTENLETLVKGQKNETLVRDLTEGSPLLRHIHESFQTTFNHKDCLITSFFETRDSKTLKVCVGGHQDNQADVPSSRLGQRVNG
jgi:hypothetical protein